MALDREAGEFFLRTRAAIFPGMKIAEIFGVSEGPLYEQMERNILHVNGADHSRLRGLVNPALCPRAVERYRPRDADFLEGLLDEALGRRHPEATSCEFVEAFAQALPLAGDRDRDGRPARGRATPPPLVELDPAAVRRRQHGDRTARRSSGSRGVLRVRQALVAARRGDPGDDLISRAHRKPKSRATG